MKTIACLLVVLGVLVGESLGHDMFLNRWRRQVLHCQPDDVACQRCSSCSTVETSHLPECCEAYNACCDEYFQACKQCSNVASKDHFFPEYCCASFTDCCDLITTFTTQVKPPAPVKPKPKLDLKIPEVAAPKPTTFPGDKAMSVAAASSVRVAAQEAIQPLPNTFQNDEFAKRPAFSPEKSVFAPQTPAIRPQQSAFVPRTPELRQQDPSFAVQSPVGVAPEAVDNSQRQRTRTQARAQARPQTRAQARPQTRGRQQTNRRSKQGGVDLDARRGRVTSRGRVST